MGYGTSSHATEQPGRHPQARDDRWYFPRAIILVALLWAAGRFAPSWPTAAFLLVFPAYAIPATIGAMYNVVTNRHHRQYKYNKDGRLSHYNRRWLCWLVSLFVLYLFSALMFVLESPSWDDVEWLLMLIAIPGYYLVFLAMQRLCKREYAPKFYKAAAIRWSLFITTGLLCLGYAITAFWAPASEPASLATLIQSRSQPFENSPCALLSELDKLSTYAGCLTEYGLGQIAGSSYAVAFITKLVISVSVFFGIVSQLSSCLLDNEEILGVFRLLPTSDDDPEARPIRKRYLLVLLAIFVTCSALFLWAECEIEKMRATSAYTMTSRLVDDSTDLIVLVSDHEIEEIKQAAEEAGTRQAFTEEFGQRKDAFIAEHEEPLRDLVNDYYDRCIDNVDSYLEWYDSIPGGFARLAAFIGGGMAADEFDGRVIKPVDRSDVDAAYADYLGGLKQLYDEYWSSEVISGDNPQVRMPTSDELLSLVPQTPELWMTWSGDRQPEIVSKTLLNADRDNAREGILALIEEERATMLATIEGLPWILFYA